VADGLVVAYNGADAGLGNRLRVTLGAARYARWRDARFLYVWPTTSAFQPALTDLWEWRDGVRIPRVLSRAAGVVTGYVGSDLRAVRPRPIIQVRTGAELLLPLPAGNWTEDLRALSPVDEIARTITAIHTAEFGAQPYVGVQIRTHHVSHAATKQSSPVTWFADRMQAVLDRDPDRRFYLSCDVPEVKDRLLARFPTAVAHRTDAAYNSTSAVRAAIVDLYLLASSSAMLGPHGSSFVEMAQFLSDLRVPTEKPTESSVSLENAWGLPGAPDPLRPAARRSMNASPA